MSQLSERIGILEKQAEKSGISGAAWSVIVVAVLVALMVVAFFWDGGLDKVF